MNKTKDEDYSHWNTDMNISNISITNEQNLGNSRQQISWLNSVDNNRYNNVKE